VPIKGAAETTMDYLKATLAQRRGCQNGDVQRFVVRRELDRF
jgi:hypothetical protein